MSASKKKKERQADVPEQMTEREARRQEDAKSDHRSMLVYTVTAVLVVILTAFAVVMNSGLLQRSATAVTINGTKYNAAEVQYYYNSALANSLGITPGSMDLKGTVLDTETGETAHDYVLDLALDTMVSTAAIIDQATAEGVTLSQATQDSIDAYMAQIDATWVTGGYPNRDTFIRAQFGPYMTDDKLVELLKRDALVTEYINNQIMALEYSDSDYDAYYEEHADELDSFTYTQFVFQASVPTTDAEGKTIEMTDEEKAAALEEAKAEMKAAADALKAKLEAGTDPEVLDTEYADLLYSSEIHGTRVGTSVNSNYSEWMLDAARKAGDITTAEYGSTTFHNYYVVRFENRQLDDANSNSVRHILVADEATANELLNQWKSGEATEDAFATLAAQNSSDSGSASYGGLITGITPTSSYVENFLNWTVDPSRQAGDTGVVSSDYGWHVMYYVGKGAPVWVLTADDALRNAAYTEMITNASNGYEAVEGSGIKYVG